MFDKVKFWINRDSFNSTQIINRLDEANTQVNTQTGEMCIYGSLDGLKVSIYSGGVSIVGSLPKYLYDSNVYALDRASTKQAVEKLSDTLQFRADEAKVTAVEFGTSFLMSRNVRDYLLKLGDMPRLERYHFTASTLYYKGVGKTQPKVFAFYDKILDAKDKGMDYPKNLEKANLLRYEMRYRQRVAQQLGVPEITASTLYQKPFYSMMIQRYQDSYLSITKKRQLKADIMSNIKTVGDALDVLVARLLIQTDQTQITAFLDELKESKAFEDRKNYSRLKKKIQEITAKADTTEASDLIKELDDDIKNVGAYV